MSGKATSTSWQGVPLQEVADLFPASSSGKSEPSSKWGVEATQNKLSVDQLVATTKDTAELSKRIQIDVLLQFLPKGWMRRLVTSQNEIVDINRHDHPAWFKPPDRWHVWEFNPSHLNLQYFRQVQRPMSAWFWMAVQCFVQWRTRLNDMSEVGWYQFRWE